MSRTIRPLDRPDPGLERVLWVWDDTGAIRAGRPSAGGFHGPIGGPGPSADRPKPRVNLTRYHGILAPNHRWRGLVTPARRGKGVKPVSNPEVRSTAERHAAMTWAQRLKRVFNIEIVVCARCGGSIGVIACIEDQDVMPDKAGQALEGILAHLRDKEQNTPALPHLAPPTRAPPGTLPALLHNLLESPP